MFFIHFKNENLNIFELTEGFGLIHMKYFSAIAALYFEIIIFVLTVFCPLRYNVYIFGSKIQNVWAFIEIISNTKE